MATESVSIIIKAFDQTQKALRGIKRAFASLSKIFFNFKTALVAAVGAGGMGLLIANSLKATDALAKTASKIGTTTESLSALQYAGQLTGVEVNTMNMALQRFTRRTAEAAVGTGEAKGALRELRVDARKLSRMPLDQQMLTLADAFEDAKTRGVNPLKIAFKLFDSEGAALVNTLALGRDGLTELLGEARALGVVMSSSAAKGVEDANDSLFRMQSLFGGIVKQAVAGLAPALAALSDLLTTKVQAGIADANGSVKEFGEELAGNFVQGLADAIKGIQEVLNAFVSMGNFVINFRRQINDAFSSIETKSLQGLEEDLAAVEERLADYAKTAGPFSNTNEEIVATQERLRDSIKAQIAAIKELGEESDRTFTGFTEFDFSAIIASLLRVKEAIGTTTNDIGNLGDNVNEKLPSAFETFMANLQNTREMAGDLTPSLEKLGDQAITGLGDSFTSAITGAKKFSDAIRNMAKSVIDSLIKMLVQKYLVDAAFGAITGAISNARADADFLGIEASNFRARGGPVTGGQPYIVGERGPELMIPSGNGSIVPNNQLGGSGVTVVQNINVTTGVQQTVRAEIANLLPQISNAAKSAVADARLRGGGFSKAMVGA